MELRQLTDDDREAFARLARYAFEPTKNTYEDSVPEDFELTPWLDDMSQIYGIFEGETLVSASAFFTSALVVRKKEFPMGGVWGVATSPHYRNQGLTRKMFNKILQEMHSNGVLTSVLYPFKFSFYEKFGYKLVNEHHRYQIEIRDIIFRSVKDRSVREVFELDHLKKAYAKVVASCKYNYMVKRTKADWRRKINPKKPGYFFVCYDEEDSPCGYVIVRFEEKGATDYEKSEETIYLAEIFWLDRNTKQALFNFLRAHLDHRKYILFSSADPNIMSFVRDAYIKECKVLAGSMARLVDVQSVLEAFDYSQDTNFVLQVGDETCAWNDKTYQFTVEQGEARLEETKEKADVIIDIGPLSQMVFGYRTASQLYESWDINCSTEMLTILDRLFTVQTNFLRDFF